jgi:hypothetical protein
VRRTPVWKRWLALLLILGVTQRVIRYLLCFPIWGDEAFVCLNLLDRDYVALAGPLRFDQVAPVLFLWGEKTVCEILGYSELALRLLPLLLGLAGLLLFARLARTLLPPAGALLATGFLAVAYYPIRHSCEVKPYAFDLFASVLLLTLAASWLRRPRRAPLALLALCGPLALALSYPAALVAGAVSLALFAHLCKTRDRTFWLLFIVYDVSIVVTFGCLFWLVGRGQHAAMITGSSGYWDGSFPPTDPAALPRWLLDAHTGNMLAYPVGGRNGGSTLTLLLCLAGIVALRRRRGLLLLLAPFALTLTAATMGKYPYGGSARVAQHLAPCICLLAGAGTASLVRRFGSVHRAWQTAVVVLVLIGMAGLLRDIRKPFKTEGDQRARDCVRSVLDRAGHGQTVVVLNAPPRLYPSLEWYLRTGGNVLWADCPSDARLPGNRSPFLSLHFATNALPQPQVPLSWEGEQGRFFPQRREDHFLGLGPEPDATRSCVIVWWSNSAGPVGGGTPRSP